MLICQSLLLLALVDVPRPISYIGLAPACRQVFEALITCLVPASFPPRLRLVPASLATVLTRRLIDRRKGTPAEIRAHAAMYYGKPPETRRGEKNMLIC